MEPWRRALDPGAPSLICQESASPRGRIFYTRGDNIRAREAVQAESNLSLHVANNRPRPMISRRMNSLTGCLAQVALITLSAAPPLTSAFAESKLIRESGLSGGIDIALDFEDGKTIAALPPRHLS